MEQDKARSTKWVRLAAWLAIIAGAGATLALFGILVGAPQWVVWIGAFVLGFALPTPKWLSRAWSS